MVTNSLLKYQPAASVGQVFTLYNKALALIKQREFTIALKLLDAAIKHESNLDTPIPAIYETKGDVLTKMGLDEDAAKAFFDAGLKYLRMGKTNSGLESLNKAVLHETSAKTILPDIHAARGEAYLLLGQYEKSLIDFEVAINHFGAQSPKLAFAYFSKSKALVGLGNNMAALNAINEAVAISEAEIFLGQKAAILEAIVYDTSFVSQETINDSTMCERGDDVTKSQKKPGLVATIRKIKDTVAAKLLPTSPNNDSNGIDQIEFTTSEDNEDFAYVMGAVLGPNTLDGATTC